MKYITQGTCWFLGNGFERGCPQKNRSGLKVNGVPESFEEKLQLYIVLCLQITMFTFLPPCNAI